MRAISKNEQQLCSLSTGLLESKLVINQVGLIMEHKRAGYPALEYDLVGKGKKA